MRIQELSEKSLRFQGANSDLSSVSDNGVLIRFVEIDDWLHVLLDVGEDTTSRDLRDAIPLVLNWRDRLLKWQGPWLRGGNNPFIEELCRLNDTGTSYTDLAKRINNRIAEYLTEFTEFQKELESARPGFRTMLDDYLWQPTTNQFSFEHARGLLQALRMKEDEIDELLTHGLENIKSGKPAFEEDYPLSREKLIGTLRTWRRGSKHKIANMKDSENDCLPE